MKKSNFMVIEKININHHKDVEYIKNFGRQLVLILKGTRKLSFSK